MLSTINSDDFQSTLDQFEQIFGISWNDFVSLDSDDQLTTFLNVQDQVDSNTAYSIFDNLYAYFHSLQSVYNDMLENGNALERAQAEIYLADLSSDWATVQNLSTTWGDSQLQNQSDNQQSDGRDINYELENPYNGQEVTLDLSENGQSQNSNWVTDPNAENPYMSDSDGDGYKDTLFYVSSRSEYDVVNLEGNTVNIDTDGDGDIDQYDGLNADYGDIPTCTLDLNGASWEIVDFNPETQTYRLKVITEGDPDVESYINIIGPCYISPTDGTPPDEATLRSYPEEVLRILKQSPTASTTLGDVLYGAQVEAQDRTIIMDSNTNQNEYHDTITEDMWEAEATFTVALEAEEKDNFYLDCQNADAHFEWQDGDLYIYLTNEEGQTVTYILKGFETAGMDDYSDQNADALHLSNVDISDEEYANLYYMAPGYGTGDPREAEYLGAAYYAFSMASYIYVDEETNDDGENVSLYSSEEYELDE